MFKFTNFVTPGTIYHGTVSKGVGDGGTADVSLKVYRETKVPGITSTDFETKQVRRWRVVVGGSFIVVVVSSCCEIRFSWVYG